MEKTDVAIENEEQIPEESRKVIDQVADHVSKEFEEKNDDDDEIVPSTTPKPIEEQENIIEINSTVPSSVSPSRINVPFKEVNDSEKEESMIITKKKRELENEDEQIQEKILDNDQTKRIKTNESTDIPLVEEK